VGAFIITFFTELHNLLLSKIVRFSDTMTLSITRRKCDSLMTLDTEGLSVAFFLVMLSVFMPGANVIKLLLSLIY
jgi:hypothetical protein